MSDPTVKRFPFAKIVIVMAVCFLVGVGLCGLDYALGARGICRIKVHAPRVIQESDYVLRLVSLGVTLRYPILSQV